MKKFSALTGLALAIAVAGCSGGATSVATSQPAAATAAAQATAAPPASSGTEIKTFALGDVIEVTGEFSSDLRVRVSKVETATKYGDYSTPKAGNVYLAVYYEYESIEDGATYNPFDGQVFVDGTAVENYSFVLDGPEPQLSSGTLPKGRKASGWVVYEVPKAGQVILSYGGAFSSDGPTFEVIAREK